MPNILKKFLMDKESYKGSQFFSFLDFRAKIVVAIILLTVGIIFQGYVSWKNYFDLHAKLSLTSTVYRQLNYLCELRTIGSEIPAKSVVAVRNNTTLDLEDRLSKMDQVLRRLDQKILDEQWDKINGSFKALVTQVKYHQIFHMNQQQYHDLSKVYQRYLQSITNAEKKLNSYYSKHLSILNSTVLRLVVSVIILIILLVFSGWLVLIASRSITEPAHLIIKFFESEASQRRDYQLPVSTFEGLGATASLINQSFTKWDAIFARINESVVQFKNLVQNLVAEFHKEEVSEVQMLEIHKVISNYLSEQNDTVKNANEQLTFLVANLANMQRIPYQLTQRSEKIENLLLLNENRLNETVNQPLEIIDDTKPFIPLFQDLSGTSSRIKNMTAILGEIAEHTELLAFNTAIEAAKAGNKGLGFSVVSKEITKLVERSKQASQNLNNNIKDFQTKTDLTIKLLPKTVITDDALNLIRQRTAEVCSNVLNAIRDSVINLGHLAQVLEEIHNKSGQIAQEAKLTSGLSFDEKDELKQIESGVLNYQVSMKDALHMAGQMEILAANLLATLNPISQNMASDEILG